MGDLLSKYKLPPKVKVQVKKTREGTFYAKFPELPGCLTEADDPVSLISQVNDAIYTYFDIPRKELKDVYVLYFPPQDYFKKLLNLKASSKRKPKSQARWEFGYIPPVFA